MIYLDTHVAVDLWERAPERLSRQARKYLDADDDLRISPMVLLELEYLHEIGKLKPGAAEVARGINEDLGVRVCEFNFAQVAREALAEGWTCDPFDRLIVAQARLQKARLITRDTRMHRQYRLAHD